MNDLAGSQRPNEALRLVQRETRQVEKRRQEGEEVGKTRLKSVWLALVLLALACGTAFAQLDLSIEPGCIECCPLPWLEPCPEYAAFVVSRGWEPDERLIQVLTGPGPAGPFGTGMLSADDRGRLDL